MQVSKNTTEHRLIISPEKYDAVIFDLDGVVTRTATVHAAAWKRLFDAFLRERAERSGEDFRPFEIETDYRRHVDGKPRYDGVKDFLASRSIELPWGSPDNDPDMETVCGLGNRKNDYFRAELQEHGAEVYASTVFLVRRLQGAGIRTAIISASRNCAAVLQAAGIEELFEARVDGVEADRLQLKGKPAPDVFLEAARRLDARPARTAIVEDAMAGVAAGAAGQFACVIGVDRTGQAEELRESGADVVVADLAEVAVAPRERRTDRLPSALAEVDAIMERSAPRRLAVFLDYDGVLTPIVRRPEEALISPEMRETVRRLAGLCPVAVVSGRDRRDVRQMVGVDGIAYAGSHGFDIEGPDGTLSEFQPGVAHLPGLDAAEQEVGRGLQGISGARLERKRFALAIHFREVKEADVPRVEEVVDAALSGTGGLRKTGGKKIFELRPDIDWDKGRAVFFLMEQLGLDGPEVLPLYLGDDLTDEDAFRDLQGVGIGVVVRDEARPTFADYALEDPEEARVFLAGLADRLREV